MTKIHLILITASVLMSAHSAFAGVSLDQLLGQIAAIENELKPEVDEVDKQISALKGINQKSGKVLGRYTSLTDDDFKGLGAAFAALVNDFKTEAVAVSKDTDDKTFNVDDALPETEIAEYLLGYVDAFAFEVGVTKSNLDLESGLQPAVKVDAQKSLDDIGKAVAAMGEKLKTKLPKSPAEKK
jgi:hypothetical protein